MKLLSRTLLAVGCVAGFATPVLADDDVPSVSDAPDGQDTVTRGVQSPAGMISVRVSLGINLSSDRVGKPISLAPNIYYGVSDKFQLGIVHDGPMRLQTPPGPGLCLTGEDNGCPNVYDNIGVDAMFGLLYGPAAHLSAHGTIYATSFDAGTAMLTLGVTGKVHLADSTALYFDPQIGIQLAKRDDVEDALYCPVELQYQVALPTTVKLLTGIAGPLDGFGDAYQVPVGIGINQNVNRQVDVGGRFSFDNLLGKQPGEQGRADTRSVVLQLTARL